MKGKINNQQRKNLCNLIDVRTEASIASIDSSDANMLILVSNKLKKNKNFLPLQKQWEALEKKRAKKKADNNAKILKLKEELELIEDEKDEVRQKIELIGIKPSTGIVCHDKKYIGTSYRDQRYRVEVFGEMEDLWNGIMNDHQDEKEDILASATSTKEKIWLAETREEAEKLIKE